MSTELAVNTKTLTQAATPSQMLQSAIERGLDDRSIERLLDLQERWEGNEARKAFVQAMSKLKANPPKLVKDQTVSFSGTSYQHASLAAVVDAVVSGMSQNGLSHHWEVEQENGLITVSCTITHEMGHRESVKMTAPPDDSGKKNRIQQIASTVTYLQRYTLMAAFGLAAKDMDDDARSVAPPALLTDAQMEELYNLATETNADIPNFLKALKVSGDTLEQIPAAKFDLAKQKLTHKLRSMQGAK